MSIFNPGEPEEPEDIITDKTMNCRFSSSNAVANQCDAVSNAYLTFTSKFYV